MTKKECKNVVIVLLNELLQDRKQININENYKLFDDLGMDSLSIIGFIVQLEDKFEISIDDLEDFDVFDSIDSTVDFVYKYLE